MYVTLKNYRRAPSAEYQRFKRKVKKWVDNFGPDLLQSGEYQELQQLIDIKHYPIKLKLELTFHVNRTKIVCKDGRTKRYDTSNRVKAVEDAIFGILDIDDKHVWKVTAEKVVIEGDSYVTAKVSVMGGV
jgi:Holliday junction resolvase RusA-like endonuclease